MKNNIRNSIINEITLFSIAIITKLLLFNMMLNKRSITNPVLHVSIIGAVFMLFSWTTLISKKLRVVLLYIADGLVTALIIADLFFYRYFSDVISMPVLTQASNVASVKSSVISLFHSYDIVFLLDLVIIPAILYFNRGTAKPAPRKLSTRLARFAISLVVGITLYGGGIASLLKSQPDIFDTFYDRIYIVQNIGLLGFHSIDAFKFVKSVGKDEVVLSENEKDEIAEFILNKKNQVPAEPKLFGAGKGKNLIVIQVEALQEFVINSTINGKEITPNLNRIARESIYFDNYYSETAGGGTSDAEFLSNTSLFPVRDGSAYIRFSENEYYSLARKLKEEGYGTAVMHAYKADFWNRSAMYQSLCFDEYISRNDYEEDEIIGMGLSDKSFFAQSLDRMKMYEEPFYGFLITLTSHYPFDNDKRYYSSFDAGEYKDTFLGDYFEAIHYADEAVGYFIDELDKEGLLDRSIVAIYGDHFAVPRDKKEELAEYLKIKDMDEYNWVKHLRVPMLIHFPGGSHKGVNHTAGGGVDFMPTILNIMGVESSDIPMLGRDLLNTGDGMAVLRNGNFIISDYICLTSGGKAFNCNTGEAYPVEKLEAEREYSKRLLEYSDKIIENNLVGELIEYLRKYGKAS